MVIILSITLVIVAVIITVAVIVSTVGSSTGATGATVGGATNQGTKDQSKTTYVNPVLHNLPDPSIVLDGDTYWAFGTNPGFGFTAFSSDDLKTWTSHGTALEGGGPRGDANFWAPECFKRDGTWYLTYTAGSRIYIARSTTSSAKGPYAYYAGPLRPEWGIDSHYFRDPVSKNEYLFFATAAGIHVGRLVDSMKRLTDEKFCFGNAPPHKEGWVTSTVNEAPWCIYSNGTYYLVYSGNGTGPSYAVGFATSNNVTGPWTKSSSNPIVSAPGTGPGHCCFFETKGGQRMIGYHRHIGAPAGRNMCIDRVTSIGNGKIVIDGPTNTPQPLPR